MSDAPPPSDVPPPPADDPADKTPAPPLQTPPSRRRVLKLAAISAAGAAAGAGAPVLLNKLAGKPGPKKWRFLTDAEAVLVEAICEQIIPADQDPGARDAGVLNFIDKQLVGHHRKHQDKYRKGLAAVQKTSQQMLGKPFEQLAFDDQTKVLEAMESSKVPKDIGTSPSASEFFNLIRDHTMQGFYGSPRHGGNRNYVSYKMLGLEAPRVIGRNRA